MKTNVTLQQKQKELAISFMKQLDIYQLYIDVFEKDNVVSYFERYIGYWAYQDSQGSISSPFPWSNRAFENNRSCPRL